MSLINHIEIIEQDEEKLNAYLTTELKNTANWRENKSDDVKDQCNFFQSYFEKGFGSNMHIDKGILSQLLQESEKYNRNDIAIPQTNFLEIVINENKPDAFDLLFFDSLADKLKVISISNGNDNDNGNCDGNDTNHIELVDLNEGKVLTDTKVFDMKVNSLNPNSITLMDMYSIYDITISDSNTILEDDNDQDTKSVKHTKRLTLPEIPNVFLSPMLIDKFFIISQGNNDNWLHLINDSYQIISKTNLNHSISQLPYLKGEFLGLSEHIAVYNKDTIRLLDFRCNNTSTDSILFHNDSFNINELKYIENFNYITFSPQQICLFDLRYPSLQISSTPININYSQFKMKEVIKGEGYHGSLALMYTCIDDSRRDQSHLLFKVNERIEGILNGFCSFDLIKNDKLQIDIHDSVSYINDNGSSNSVYMNFIVDNLSGVYLNVYDLGMKKKRSFHNVSFKEESSNDIGYKTVNGDVIDLFKKAYVNQVYDKPKEENDDNDNKERGKNEIDFGSVIINGSKKKMYRVQSKRDFIDKVLQETHNTDNKDVVMTTDTPNQDNTNKHDLELNENDENKLKFLIDDFNISDQ